VIASLASLLLSCGATAPTGLGAAPLPSFAGAPAFDGELTVRPEGSERPALDLRIPVVNAHSVLGYGVVHLWARPREDDVGVTALIDAPASRARWAGCRSVLLRTGSHELRIPARYVGRSMGGTLGVYDAVQVDLDVLIMRKIAGSPSVTGVACGDAFELTSGQRATVGRFVEWFDTLAVHRQLRDAPGWREVGPRIHLLPLEEEDDTPQPG